MWIFCGLFVLFSCASFFIVIADRTMWIWRRWSIIMWNRVVSVWDGTRISLPCLPVNNPVWGFSSFCHTRADRAAVSVTVREWEREVFHTESESVSGNHTFTQSTLICFQASMYYGELTISSVNFMLKLSSQYMTATESLNHLQPICSNE